MSDKKKSNKGREEFLRYSGKKIQSKERNAFERELQKDPFDAEAAEGFQIISDNDARKDLEELDKLLGRGDKKANRFLFLRIAASIAVLVVVSVLFYFLSDRQIKDTPGQITVTESQEKRPPGNDNIDPTGDISGESIKKVDKKSTPGENSKPVKTEDNLTVPKNELGVEKGAIPSTNDQNEGMGAISAKKDQTEIRGAFSTPKEQTEEKGAIAVRSDQAEIIIGSEEFIEQKEELNFEATAESNKEIYEFDAGSEPAKESILSEAGDSKKTSKNARSAMADMPPKEIHGSVISSEDKSPLPGVVIVVKGSTRGTVSDIDGNFIIPVESDSSTLVASYVGMEQEEIIAKTNKDVFISMEPTYASLDEVVVIGYGTTRSDQTGSVSDVDINQIPAGQSYSPPIPEGGKRAFEDYIEENIKFPNSDTTLIREVVVIRFLVGTNGIPHSFNVVRSPNENFSNEAIRLIREGPVWRPAKSGDKLIEEETRVRMIFKSP